MIKIREKDYEKLKDYLKDFLQVVKDESVGNYYSITEKRVVTVKQVEDFLKQLY